jgi:predicted Zn-dependent peptidase
MYQISRHETGLTVATASMPHMASVSLGIWVGVGGRFEPANINGVSHFIEHLLFKGTKHRTPLQISQDVEGVGGYLNAFTTEENTCFYSKACHDRFQELWEVLADMLLYSVFDPEEIRKERNVIKEELAMYLDQPHHHVQELLNETLWPDQPLGRPLTGTEETLDALKRPQMLSFLKSHYTAPMTVVSAAGRVEHEEIVQAVNKLAKRFPPGRRVACTPVSEKQDHPRMRIFTKQTEQTQLALGIRSCSRHDPGRYALRMLNTLLGENMSSRLFQSVREDRGLAYHISSGLGFFNDTGVLNISAGLETEKVEEALKLILKETKAFKNKPPSQLEVRRARDYLIGQMELSMESTENQMMYLGEQMLGYGFLTLPQQMKDRLAAVTPAEVHAAAKHYLRSERLNMALVTPLQNSPRLERLLKI